MNLWVICPWMVGKTEGLVDALVRRAARGLLRHHFMQYLLAPMTIQFVFRDQFHRPFERPGKLVRERHAL